MAPPNCCKRLPKRRLFARRPVGRLEQSALAGGTPPADPPQDGRGGVPRSASLCLAALQSMRTSLGARYNARYGAAPIRVIRCMALGEPLTRLRRGRSAYEEEPD